MNTLLESFGQKFPKFDRLSSAESALWYVRSQMDITDAAFLATNLPTNEGIGTYAVSTYSEEWHDHYIARSYLDIDPVVQNALRQVTPFCWQDDDHPVELKRFFGESREFGIAGNGLSIPVRGIQGEVGVFSVSSDLSPSEWRDFVCEYRSGLMILAYSYYMACVDIDFPDNRKVSLSPREYDVLSWIAKGKSSHVVAAILQLHPKTIEHHLASARIKLRASNTTHAIAKAVKWGLVNPED